MYFVSETGGEEEGTTEVTLMSGSTPIVETLVTGGTHTAGVTEVATTVPSRYTGQTIAADMAFYIMVYD